MIRLNGNPINITMFPDKTSQVWKLSEVALEGNFCNITWEFENEGELMHLAQLKLLLDMRETRCALNLKYLPYGRQDKFVGNNTTFALYAFAEMLNLMRFDEVIIQDPHSKVAVEIIKNATAVYPKAKVNGVLALTGSNLVCYPDKGALDKYASMYEARHVYGEKVRDQATGVITSYTVQGDPKDAKVLIIDDICDGGATFKILAEQLYLAGATEVNLFVTHGIFSKGIETLRQSGIKRIFTQDGEKE